MRRYRKVPLPLQKKDAMKLRMQPNHPKLPIIEQDIVQEQRGFNGEKQLDYHLRSLPQQFIVLNDITLIIAGKKVQIDTLTITPYAIYIIEVKNFYGTITFNTNLSQLIRYNGEKLSGYKYPITQVQNIHFHLLKWLQQQNLSGLPIYYFIAIAEHSTIFKVIGDEDFIREKVLYVDAVPLKLMQIDKSLSQQRKGNNQQQNKISNKILENCVEFDYNVFAKYDISKSEILPGVHCPNCGKLGMTRSNSKWFCSKCEATSTDAHFKALRDYFLLISHYITNKQCRDFLLINSRHAAKRMMKQFGLVHMDRGKIWYLPEYLNKTHQN